MEETTLAYAAGLLDGEGTVTLTYLHKGDEWRAPVVSCSSTTHELLAFLKEHWGGSISRHKVYQEHHTPSWSWKISRRKAIDMLAAVLPYMKEPEKIRRAKLLLEEYVQVTPRNGQYTAERRERKADFEQRFLSP